MKLIERPDFPESYIIGSIYHCSTDIIEWLNGLYLAKENEHPDDEEGEKIEPLDKKEVAERMMFLLIALGANPNNRSIKTWQSALAKWKEHRLKYPR